MVKTGNEVGNVILLKLVGIVQSDTIIQLKVRTNLVRGGRSIYQLFTCSFGPKPMDSKGEGIVSVNAC